MARPNVASRMPAFTNPHESGIFVFCDRGFRNTSHSPFSPVVEIRAPGPGAGCPLSRSSRARLATASVISSGKPKYLPSSTACQSRSTRFRVAPTVPSTSAASIRATILSSGRDRISAARCTLLTNLHTFCLAAMPFSPESSRAYRSSDSTSSGRALRFRIAALHSSSSLDTSSRSPSHPCSISQNPGCLKGSDEVAAGVDAVGRTPLR
mmetsp:Transcript_1737/g.5779  ORF Transcript_1737/g.5779 Transcript_1737/m.5779 type:complete len:209 (-) Transcript_1737:526-1152(-)